MRRFDHVTGIHEDEIETAACLFHCAIALPSCPPAFRKSCNSRDRNGSWQTAAAAAAGQLTTFVTDRTLCPFIGETRSPKEKMKREGGRIGGRPMVPVG